MVTSKRTSSVVWCLLLAGLLLAAAEVQAGRVQKQEAEVGAENGIVADAAGECFWNRCQWATDKFQCMLDCGKENPPAGSADMGLGAKRGIVGDAAGECFTQNCQWLHAPASIRCMFDCGKLNSPAVSTDVTLPEDGSGAGTDGAILQVV